MLAPAPSRPAIVGAAQRTQRVQDPREALEPIALMEEALRDAATDAGAPALLGALDLILVPHGLWKYGDPGKLLGERVGARAPRTGLGAVSGHMVQVLVDFACAEIAAGRSEVVAIVGGESEHSKRRMANEGIPLPWPEPAGGEPDLRFGFEQGSFAESEIAMGIVKPSVSFALCETSLRGARGEAPAAHRERISELSSRLSAVAAQNPYAWINRHVSAHEIRTPTPANRMVTYPYTKLMTANIAVDQAAAFIICTEAAAKRLGIARDKHVYLRAATEMNHVAQLSDREHLHHHPGLHAAGARVLELVDTRAEDIKHVDLYSCFPFAVQAFAGALGLDEERPLTVTGGLTFSGGPFGNYVVQAMARMVELLRASPGELGLTATVGGNFAKFAFGVYSTDPGESAAPVIEDVSDVFAAIEPRKCLDTYSGPARVESYAVDVLHEGPVAATFSTFTDAGERVWARSSDPGLMNAILADEDFCGRELQIRSNEIQSA